MSTTAYHKRWRLDRARGISRTTDARHVAAWIRELHKQGMTSPVIAEFAGCYSQTIAAIGRGERTRTNIGLAQRILAVSPGVPENVGPDSYVPSVGAYRRIQALLAIGWTHADITARSGVSTTYILSRALRSDRPGRWVASSTHWAIARAFDEMSMTPGPSSRGAQVARSRGYAPPLAWDEETIDDPHAKPDLGSQTPGRWDARWENLDDLVALGEPRDRARERLGISLEADERRKYRQRAEGAA